MMKPGTLVELPDGRRGRVVYHNLDGYGIKWGEGPVDVDAIMGVRSYAAGITEPPEVDNDFKWQPDAMLRDPYPRAQAECVGEVYTVIEENE